VAPLSDLKEGRTVKFTFRKGGVERGGFAFRRGGRFHAYVNQCRHWAVGLDFDDNRFFTPDGRFLICVNHGALYDPSSGKCVSGPCEGASLSPLKTRVRRGVLVAEP